MNKHYRQMSYYVKLISFHLKAISRREKNTSIGYIFPKIYIVLSFLIFKLFNQQKHS